MISTLVRVTLIEFAVSSAAIVALISTLSRDVPLLKSKVASPWAKEERRSAERALVAHWEIRVEWWSVFMNGVSVY